jgi:hypothetical protein
MSYPKKNANLLQPAGALRLFLRHQSDIQTKSCPTPRDSTAGRLIRTGVPSGILSTLNLVAFVPTSPWSACGLIEVSPVAAKTFSMDIHFFCVGDQASIDRDFDFCDTAV